MKAPDVTVVTPTLNAVTYFQQTLDSVALQRSFIDVEHIVVDDGSTDGTRELAERNGAIVVEGHRQGLYAAMNLGLARSLGDIVGVLNADDWLFPEALIRVSDTMKRLGRPWAVGALRWVDSTGKTIGELAPPPDWLPAWVLASLRWSYIGHPATYMRRGFYESIGGFEPSLTVAADFALLMRARHASRFARVASPVAAFRRHGLNNSRRSPQLDADVSEVAARHAPASVLIRTVTRFSTSAAVNLRNPTWAIRKRRYL